VCQTSLKLSLTVNECKPLVHGQRRDGGVGRRGAPGAGPGRAVQVDPIEPKLKPPGYTRLKPKHNSSLSSFAFKFNLRRYSLAEEPPSAEQVRDPSAEEGRGGRRQVPLLPR